MITYQCNLNCSYCQINKEENKKMPLAVAKKAIDSFWQLDYSQEAPKCIKIFGGEPFLYFDFLQELADYVASKYSNYYFHITTNGSLLNEEIINWIQSNPVKLVVSLDGSVQTQIKNRQNDGRSFNCYENILRYKDKVIDKITVNMVIAPNTVFDFMDNLQHIIGLGFRQINFLPAYYVEWTTEQLTELKRQFSLAAPYLVYNQPIDVYNLKIKKEKPFFNEDLFVDYNGDVFVNNLFLDKKYVVAREELLLGNINDLDNFDKLLNLNNDNSFFEQYKTSPEFKSTENVDSILTDFLNTLIRLSAKTKQPKYIWKNT